MHLHGGCRTQACGRVRPPRRSGATEGLTHPLDGGRAPGPMATVQMAAFRLKRSYVKQFALRTRPKSQAPLRCTCNVPSCGAADALSLQAAVLAASRTSTCVYDGRTPPCSRFGRLIENSGARQLLYVDLQLNARHCNFTAIMSIGLVRRYLATQSAAIARHTAGYILRRPR
jgi:hypothetical protein